MGERSPSAFNKGGEVVVCLEVTGEHLERDKLERKLVRISEAREG